MRNSARGRPLGRSPTVGKEVQPNYTYTGSIRTKYETPILCVVEDSVRSIQFLEITRFRPLLFSHYRKASGPVPSKSLPAADEMNNARLPSHRNCRPCNIMQFISFKIIKRTDLIFYAAVFNSCVIITESPPVISNVSGDRSKFLIINPQF